MSVSAHPNGTRQAMTLEEYKMFVCFITMGYSRFSSALGEDAHKFILSYKERLHNLSLVESCKLEYTTFQIERLIK